jgi:hypothetical protein
MDMGSHTCTLYFSWPYYFSSIVMCTICYGCVSDFVHTVAKQCRGISVRHLRPLLVCFRGYHPSSAFCTGMFRLLSALQAMKLLIGIVPSARSKTETQCTLCPHFPRNHRNSMGQPRPLRVPDLRVGSDLSSFSLGHYV